MPRKLFPSSFECDCGHPSYFFENTIKGMKATSYKKRVRLGDVAPNEHFIVFYQGEMQDIICPHRGAKKTSRQSVDHVDLR